MVPKAMHLEVLRLLSLKGHIIRGDHHDWRKTNVAPFFKMSKDNSRNYRLVSHAYIYGKTILLLEAISGHIKETEDLYP